MISVIMEAVCSHTIQASNVNRRVYICLLLDMMASNDMDVGIKRTLNVKLFITFGTKKHVHGPVSEQLTNRQVGEGHSHTII